jgi:hypothetical protein
MAIPQENVKAVFDKLNGANLLGEGPPEIPWGDSLTADAVVSAIDADSDALPLVFRDGYAEPLRRNLPHVLRAAGDPTLVETLAGAVYDHGSEEVRAPLGRFLAVVSNMYRSFLDAETRMGVDLPLIEQLPPLAMFQHSGEGGPFTLTAESVQGLIGSPIGVVSLPSTCREHPFTWASLAHETGGHDVLHADTGLLDELAGGVRDFFGSGRMDPAHPTGAQVMGHLWAWWIDEAASDVYGLLNIGPSFAMNLIVFLATFIAGFTKGTEPVLRAESGRKETDALDVHPVDLLRPHLAIGAIEGLSGLDPKVRQDYVSTIEAMAAQCSGGEDSIALVGLLPIGDNRGLPLANRFPLKEMQDVARRVGSFIVSANLPALGGHCIQDLETWDDADEAAARRIADTFRIDASAVGVGDDAQLLAGATIAILEEPDKYDTCTKRLNEALDHSFAVDPIWGAPQRDPIWEPVRPLDEGHFLDRYTSDLPLLTTEAPKLATA